MSETLKDKALAYHKEGRPGKLEIIPSKACSTQADLTLAYTPGVAEPCLEIEKNPELANDYTIKNNLVAVISNGTAVLGLGNIGALASKPVMEGKSLLFKVYSDIDSYDIEVDTEDIDKFVETVCLISPSFGGINLEDIKAPECFEIERRIKEKLNIPVMHDDQHGTAIISGAALLNSLEIADKRLEDVKIVFSGAGAAAIACANFYLSLGVKPEQILMFDKLGFLHTSRTDLHETHKKFAKNVSYNSLAEALKDADVFVGLSAPNLVTPEMIKTMNSNPIVFAMANPNPEIPYQTAVESREDLIMATGRSDNPNQVNNVLGFPYIFRGALDVKAICINEEMKLAAAKAIASLAKEPVTDAVLKAYNLKELKFGKTYFIPKPLDTRLISVVSPAVALAAMQTGVARQPITDWDAYKKNLDERISRLSKFKI